MVRAALCCNGSRPSCKYGRGKDSFVKLAEVVEQPVEKCGGIKRTLMPSLDRGKVKKGKGKEKEKEKSEKGKKVEVGE